jgi:flagellar biosynthesis protein FlhF
LLRAENQSMALMLIILSQRECLAKSIAELANSPRVEKLLTEISEVKNLLQSHVAGNFWGNLQQEKTHLTEVIKHLLNTGFSPQLCADITRKLPETSDLSTLLQSARDQIKEMVKTVDAFAMFDKGGVFAFIGPTGVGKTTTVAKIAARCVLRYGRNQVTLLTTDTYRIGAQEQLKVFAKILGLTVTSLRDGEDLSSKLKELSGRKIVLLDTAGVSQRDTLMLEQSKTLQDGSQTAVRILVMSSTTDLRTQEEVIKLHNQAAQSNGVGKIEAAVITKIDEAAHIAPVVDSIIRHDMPLLFISNGQRVPEDLSLPDLDYSEPSRDSSAGVLR